MEIQLHFTKLYGFFIFLGSLNSCLMKKCCIQFSLRMEGIENMELSKKVLVALAILLTVSYGLSMAAAGVSIPGCGEGAP